MGLQIFGTAKLGRVDDWIPVVSRKNWVPKHSAYELAHSWQPAGGFPPRVATVLESSDAAVLKGISPKYCVVEKPVFLDTLKGPSWTDVMVYCANTRSDTVVIAVEGKAKEEFGPVVSDWVRAKGEKGESVHPKPSRVRRLEYLARQLGLDLQTDSSLRYQLLHRTVSAVTECELHSAAAAVVLVHSFYEDSTDNWNDYADFASALGIDASRENIVQGPIDLGSSKDTPTFFSWVSDVPFGPSN